MQRRRPTTTTWAGAPGWVPEPPPADRGGGGSWRSPAGRQSSRGAASGPRSRDRRARRWQKRSNLAGDSGLFVVRINHNHRHRAWRVASRRRPIEPAAAWAPRAAGVTTNQGGDRCANSITGCCSHCSRLAPRHSRPRRAAPSRRRHAASAPSPSPAHGCSNVRRRSSRPASARSRAARLPAGTDCLSDAATERDAPPRRPLAHRIGASAPTPTAASLDLGGDCAGARTAAAIVGCIAGSHAAAAVKAVGGAPAPGAVSAAAAHCQTQASRQASAFASLACARCSGASSTRRADLLPGTDCSADRDTAARIAARRASAAAHRRRLRRRRAGRGALRRPRASARQRRGARRSACSLRPSTRATTRSRRSSATRGFCGDAAAAVEQRIDGLLAQMTLDEKVEQMHGSGAIDGGWRTPATSGSASPASG